MEVSPKIIITPITPSRHAPTTARPITAPPRKPIKNAGRMPLLAATALRAFAREATNRPSLPAMAEKTVPQM